MHQLQVRIDGGAPGAVNMETDSALLDACANGDIPGVVRIYWFEPPCLSVGRLQPMRDVDLDGCRRDGIDVVRRPSGGRAVLHRDEVTYAVVCRSSHPVLGGPVLDSCARIHAVVSLGLRRLGVRTTAQCRPADVRTAAAEIAAIADCFARPAAHELVDESGRKLVGSAQARLGDALLQHGSILLEPAAAAGYLRDGGVSSQMGGVRQVTGRQVSREDVAEALAAAFSASLSGSLDSTTA